MHAMALSVCLSVTFDRGDAHTLSRLQRLLEGAWLLPDHELRQQQSAAEALQEQIKAELSKDRPRNMFSLSKKQRSDPAAATASLQALALQAEAAAQVVSAAASPVAVPKRPDTTAPSQITNRCKLMASLETSFLLRASLRKAYDVTGLSSASYCRNAKLKLMVCCAV